MVTFSKTLAAYSGLFILLVLFVAFLSLPKPIPEGRLLKSERLVKLVDVPQISFASAEQEPNNLTVDVKVCPPDGQVIPANESCQEEIPLMDNETAPNVTIENTTEINITSNGTYSCTDTDNGINAFKGAVLNITLEDGTEQIIPDECTDARHVNEFACNDESHSAPIEANVLCPTGFVCSKTYNACVKAGGTKTNTTVNCDSTIKAPVCGSDGKTYLNSCFAKAAGVTYASGMCKGTGDGIIDGIDVTGLTIDELTKSGIGFVCKIIIPVPADFKVDDKVLPSSSNIHPLSGAVVESNPLTELGAGAMGSSSSLVQHNSGTPKLLGKPVSISDIEQYSKYIATVTIVDSNFRFNGPYYEPTLNQLVYLDLIEFDKSLYIYNPDDKVWIGLEAQLQLTDIPVVSQALGVHSNTKAACEEQDLDKYLSSQCKDGPTQAKCKETVFGEYAAKVCGQSDLAICKQKLMQLGYVQFCKTEKIGPSTVSCKKFTSVAGLLSPPSNFKHTTIPDLIEFVKRASTVDQGKIEDSNTQGKIETSGSSGSTQSNSISQGSQSSQQIANPQGGSSSGSIH